MDSRERNRAGQLLGPKWRPLLRIASASCAYPWAICRDWKQVQQNVPSKLGDSMLVLLSFCGKVYAESGFRLKIPY
jgi:hypothetical protein